MKYAFQIIITIILSISIFPQNYNIKLKVTDFESNYPIPNVNIELSGHYFSTSDKNGEAIFRSIPGNKYSLKITHINYAVFSEEITLDSDTLLLVSLNQTSVKLKDIIVTSSKYDKDINQLPYTVSLLGTDEIAKSPSPTISDLLKSEPGISLLRDGIWGTEISIRGLNRSNIVTLIDGDRIETSTDLSARLSMVDLNDIEKIEVIKGAVSSLYGSGATGGIVNIISKSGSYSNTISLNGNYSGSYSSVNHLFSNGLNIFMSGKNWLTKLSGSYRKAGNANTPAGVLENSQFEDNSFSGLFQFKPFDNQELKLNFQQFKAIDVGIPGASSLFTANAKVSYPQELRRLYSVEYKINNLSKTFLKLSAKYFHQFISRDVENIPGIINYPAGQPPKRVSVLKISPGADHNVDGFQTQTDFSFSSNYLIAGFDFWKRNYNGLRSKEQKIEVLNPSDSAVVKTIYKTVYEKPLPDADFYSAGIYAQDEFKISNKINLTFGGRYDFIWLHNSETVNPLYETNDGVINNSPAGQTIIWQAESAQNKSYVFNIGMLYSLNKHSAVSFNAANSFRSPSLEERYQYIDLGNVVRVGDPNLKSEQGYFLDFGYRLFPNDFDLRTSIFLNSFKDLVTEEPGTYEGRNALIKVNIGKALLYGFDYSINLRISESFLLKNTLSYVRGINKKNESDLPQIAPLNGTLGLRYFISDLLSAEITAVAFNRQNKVAEGELKTPGYIYYNLYVDFMNVSFSSLSLQISTGIENIFNKGYRNHLSTNRGLIVDEPGRNIYVKANVNF